MLNFLFDLFIFPIYAIIEFLYQNVYVLSSHYAFICIFAVSFFVNLICLPMYNRAEIYQREERDIQKKLSAKVKSIKKNFKGDERFLLLSTYYRQNNYHPIMALRSSLSLLIQIPFFIAAYMFFSQPEIYGAMSVGIIKNLAQPDKLLNLFGCSINLLPILMTVINIISAEIYAKGIPAKERIQMHTLALVFLFLLYNSPSGLVIYWTLNNCFSLLKNIGLRVKNTKKFFVYSVLTILFALTIPLITDAIVIDDIPSSVKIGYITLIVSTLLVAIIYKKFKLKINDTLNKQENNKTFMLTAITLSLLVGVFVPSIVISSSPEEFSFFGSVANPVHYIFSSGAKAFGLFFLWGIIFYSFFPKKIKNLMTVISLTALFSALVNILMFRGELGLLTVDLTMNVYDAAIFKLPQTVINTLVSLTATAIAIYLFSSQKFSVIKKITTIILLSTILVTTLNIFKINKNYQKEKSGNLARKMLFRGNNQDTIKPIFELSRSGKNVIFIFVDRAISAYLPVILNNSAELKEDFSGFVYYPNCVSYFAHTILAYPAMMAGYEYTPENMDKIHNKTIIEKFKESLLVLPLIFKKNGFDTVVIHSPIQHICPFENNNEDFSTDVLFDKYEIKNAGNLNTGKSTILPFKIATEKNDTSKILKRNFFYFGLFVATPTIFKKNIYGDGSYETNDFVKRNIIWDDYVENEFLKLYSLPKYTAITNDNKDTFTVFNSEAIHINLYDKPYNQEHFTLEQQVFNILGSYMKYLKENGVYDNTRIVIVSDHGHRGQNYTTLPSQATAYNPLLFVKDFNKTGKYTTDMTFMTNADAPSITLNGLIATPINPFTGQNILSQTDKENVKILHYKDVKADYRNYPKDRCIFPNAQFFNVSKNIFENGNW